MTGLLVTNYPYSYQILATLFFGGMLLFGRLNFKRRNPNGLPLPPGPKGLPLVRNLFDFPNNKQWLVFDEWQKTYGKYFITQMHLLRISGNSRRYGLLQCSRPALFAFGLPATDNRPLREKVFKLLWQNAIAHVEWTVCIIIFLRFTTFQTFWLFQNEVGFRLPFSAIRRSMEEIQAHISGVFPPQWGVQISTYSKARGPRLFTSTACHTWQLPPPHSTVSVMHMHFSRMLIKRLWK